MNGTYLLSLFATGIEHFVAACEDVANAALVVSSVGLALGEAAEFELLAERLNDVDDRLGDISSGLTASASSFSAVLLREWQPRHHRRTHSWEVVDRVLVDGVSREERQERCREGVSMARDALSRAALSAVEGQIALGHLTEALGPRVGSSDEASQAIECLRAAAEMVDAEAHRYGLA